MKQCAQDHTTYNLSLARPRVHSLSPNQVTSALFLLLPEALSKTPGRNNSTAYPAPTLRAFGQAYVQ